MYKLFRDSIFSPKKIIQYRKKPFWFTLIYALILVVFVAFTSIAPLFSYKDISYSSKTSLIKGFNKSSAQVVDGEYIATTDFAAEIENYSFLFLGNPENRSNYKNFNEFDFVIYGDSIYKTIPSTMLSPSSLIGFGTIIGFYEGYSNINLSSLTMDSSFFDGIRTIIKNNKPVFMLERFGAEMVNTTLQIVIYALFLYLFMNITMRASLYVKKGQLYKMLVYVITPVIVAEGIMNLINVSMGLYYIILIVAFIPVLIFEKEIFRVIASYRIANNLVKDEGFMNKLKELTEDFENKKDNDNEDDNE